MTHEKVFRYLAEKGANTQATHIDTPLDQSCLSLSLQGIPSDSAQTETRVSGASTKLSSTVSNFYTRQRERGLGKSALRDKNSEIS